MNLNFTCTNTSSIDDYALYVQGALNTENLTVHGGIFASSHLNTTGIQVTGNNCSSVDQNLTLFDFEQVKAEAFGVSEYLASLRPNMVIRDGGFLSDGQFKGNQTQNYYVFTFKSCNEQNCTLPNYLYSSPEEIFFGGNWTGPYNTNYKIDKTLVFNVSFHFKHVL
jgi:choice-of-anchor A domain-containing protein